MGIAFLVCTSQKDAHQEKRHKEFVRVGRVFFVDSFIMYWNALDNYVYICKVKTVQNR